ncbi:MAG: hypothetical protein FD180_2308 [Planctomycetota bacterium]|nr:MAG: hypothetical protein FD180_2308 [Planctomycetota bacterium]
MTLKALVLAVGDDGAGRIRFVVEAVHVDTRLEPNGERGEWDSRKDKTSGLLGFRRYEAILNHTFEATINADGSIRDTKNSEWPAPKTGGKPGKERDERAAGMTHDPTPARTWLNLIFWCAPEVTKAPDGKDYPVRKMNLLDEELIHAHPDGTETVLGYPSIKSRLHSSDRERTVDTKKIPAGSDHNAVALKLAELTRKRGHAWFSAKTGCAVKTELKAQTEGAFGRNRYSSTYEWTVLLKDRGTAPLPPPSAEDTPTK